MSKFLLKNLHNRKKTNKLIKIKLNLKFYTNKPITIFLIKPNNF
jgi:hypothetical protein